MKQINVYLYCVILIIAVLIFRRYFDVFLIESYSMNNTLFDGDKVLVKKSSALDFKDIKQNEILIVTVNSANYVKRCVALPGDTILIKNARLTVNGLSQHIKSIIVDTNQNEQHLINEKLFHQKFNELVSRYYGRNWDINSFGPFVVPQKGQKIYLDSINFRIYKKLLVIENPKCNNLQVAFAGKTYTFKNNYYFLMGDNRSNSIDSRLYGPVKENDIIGKVKMILFSKRKFLSWDRMLKIVS